MSLVERDGKDHDHRHDEDELGVVVAGELEVVDEEQVDQFTCKPTDESSDGENSEDDDDAHEPGGLASLNHGPHANAGDDDHGSREKEFETVDTDNNFLHCLVLTVGVLSVANGLRGLSANLVFFVETSLQGIVYFSII